jgi:hypothetical protein
MKPMDLIDKLRARGVTVTTTRDGLIRTKPKRLVSDDERAFIRDHTALVRNALATVPLVEACIASSPTIEDDLERLTREAAQRPKGYTLFRTHRGLLHLEELSDDETRRLAHRGKLSEAEVERWHSWRRARTRYPREARAQLFALKAQRAGFHHLIVYHDGRVSLS